MDGIDLTYRKPDRYDYITAVACGMVGGLVDVFLVGCPDSSILGSWTDEQVNNVVEAFAKLNGWKSTGGNNIGVKGAIDFLEQKFEINYDQSVGDAATKALGLSLTPSKHHMQSLAHSPDVLGLFFSILNQFTSTATFIDGGRVIIMNTATFELQGGNFIAKIFCGFYNWLGHLISDVAGSSGSKGRGMGINLPFYELFNLCDFGDFDLGNKNGNRGTMADVATKVFENGYDFRFGIAMSIPVVVTDLAIRLIWAIRRLFFFKEPILKCIPTSKNQDLRWMILVGNGTLCVIDVADAGIESGGTLPGFLMHLNLVAWVKMLKLAVREAVIQAQGVDVDMMLEIFQETNLYLTDYFDKLKAIDLEKYQQEIAEYTLWSEAFENVETDEELNSLLLTTYQEIGIENPWEGDFDTFMADPSSQLVFK